MLEIQKNNQTIQLRNLQEQVQKNKEDIANHYNIDRVLANFGIKIIGQVDTEADLPLPFDGDYGDAYAVGTSEPYNFYIWTRADANSGHPEDYWFNVGGIAVVGPQGPQGEQGPVGPKGEATQFRTGKSPSGNIGDLYLLLIPGNGNGNIFEIVNDGTGSPVPQLKGNILGPVGPQGDQGIQGPVGPQGPQGPKGDTGDVGGFINIYGILTNSSQLPNPDTLNNRTIAYLIGTGLPYDLYIQVGDADGPVMWVNSGPLNVSTLVFVNGEAQNIWNADTKLNTSVVENLTDLSIPFWLDGKLQPLEGLKTYRDGKQVYLGTDTDEKLALQQNQIYLQDLLPANDPRKVLLNARTGVAFDNFAKRTVYGYDNIRVIPSINNTFGSYNDSNAVVLTYPNTSGTILTNSTAYTKAEIDTKVSTINTTINNKIAHPIKEGWTVDTVRTNLRYGNGFLNIVKYINKADSTKKLIEIDFYDISDETVQPDPISVLGFTIGKWQSSGLPIHTFVANISESLTEYKYININEYSWIVKPELNSNRQFLNAAIVSPQIYDAISVNGQATVYGLAVRFTDDYADNSFLVSGKHVKLTVQNFI